MTAATLDRKALECTLMLTKRDVQALEVLATWLYHRSVEELVAYFPKALVRNFLRIHHRETFDGLWEDLRHNEHRDGAVPVALNLNRLRARDRTGAPDRRRAMPDELARAGHLPLGAADRRGLAPRRGPRLTSGRHALQAGPRWPQPWPTRGREGLAPPPTGRAGAAERGRRFSIASPSARTAGWPLPPGGGTALGRSTD